MPAAPEEPLVYGLWNESLQILIAIALNRTAINNPDLNNLGLNNPGLNKVRT